MNDILLTRKELNPIYHAAVVAFKEAVANGKEIEEDFAPFLNEYCCRAQVRKVVEWMEYWNILQLQDDKTARAIAALLTKGALAVDEAYWAALKATGGEG